MPSIQTHLEEVWRQREQAFEVAALVAIKAHRVQVVAFDAGLGARWLVLLSAGGVA